MSEFNPDIRIVATGSDQLAISFDSCFERDAARSTRIVYASRNFVELSVAVEGFQHEANTDLGDRKPYRGRILLRIKTDGAGTAPTELVLAEPTLWLDAIGKDRKRGGAFLFPAADSVQAMVRQGACDAFSEALGEFLDREAYVDTARRANVGAAAAPASAMPYEAGPLRSMLAAPGRGGVVRRSRQDDSPARRQVQFKRKIAFAIVGTPVLVIAVMWVAGAHRGDPIREAVAQQVLQNRESRESQVELTKQTLKEMGLDPGKSNDIGCLAPNK